jgi:GTP-binding protein
MNRELALYDPELAARPQIVVLNKIDLPDVREQLKQIARPFARRGVAIAGISAATGEGTGELLESIWRALHPRPADAADQDAPSRQKTRQKKKPPRVRAGTSGRPAKRKRAG